MVFLSLSNCRDKILKFLWKISEVNRNIVGVLAQHSRMQLYVERETWNYCHFLISQNRWWLCWAELVAVLNDANLRSLKPVMSVDKLADAVDWIIISLAEQKDVKDSWGWSALATADTESPAWRQLLWYKSDKKNMS